MNTLRQETAQRKQLEEAFNFDAFHALFRKKLDKAQNDNQFPLRCIVQSKVTLWHEYHEDLVEKICNELRKEIFQEYDLIIDTDDTYTLQKSNRPKRAYDAHISLRYLAKCFLEKQTEPQLQTTITQYIRDCGREVKQGILLEALSAHDLFIRYKEGVWGYITKTQEYTDNYTEAVTPDHGAKPPQYRLALEFLEIKSTPQPLEAIIEHLQKWDIKVNERGINANLYVHKEYFKVFKREDGLLLFGLCHKHYKTINTPTTSEQLESTPQTHQWNTIPSEQPIEVNLQDTTFELFYANTHENTPAHFFEKALSHSTQFDLGLGYFSSACFHILSHGFARFILHGGTMRMYINPYMTKEDYALFAQAHEAVFEEYLLRSFDAMAKIFSQRNELFFRCLSYLIANQRIEVKIIVLKQGGIAHEKFGIFYDNQGNTLAYIGSINMTAAGMSRNLERIECFGSWRGSIEQTRIQHYRKDFEKIWNAQHPRIHVYPADTFCQHIMKKYPPAASADELVQLEEEIIQNQGSTWIPTVTNNLVQEPPAASYSEKISTTPPKISATIQSEPRFPKHYTDGALPYQKEAYKRWVAHNRQGIFDMATGTGKTVTALYCALQEYQHDGISYLLIVVPSKTLVEQWEIEVKNFNFSHVLCAYSDNSTWQQDLFRTLNQVKWKTIQGFVVITTYHTLASNKFQACVKQMPKETIFIADEAHSIGAENVRRIMPAIPCQRRIALSATPQRIYDEEGTKEIETFFADTPPYTYHYSMQQAIHDGRLTEYNYYPRLAYLNEAEMQQYAEYTHQLLRIPSTDPKAEEHKKRLLILRKNIIHKAEGKVEAFRQIIHEIGEENLQYCFVYSAAGKPAHLGEEAHEELDEDILQRLQHVLKATFPKVRCNSYTSQDDSQTRRTMLDAFSRGDIHVLFAKNCLDEGVNIPRAEYGIFTSSTGNPRQFIQRRGRLLRKHKDKFMAQIYDIVVTPDFHSHHYRDSFFSIERNIAISEMQRVAHFASMACNYYSDVERALEPIKKHYKINIADMIRKEKDKEMITSSKDTI